MVAWHTLTTHTAAFHISCSSPDCFLFQFKPSCVLCSEFETLLNVNSSNWCCLHPSYCLELAGPLSLLQYPKKKN